MEYFVGAYASSPNVSGWDPDVEGQYYQGIKNMPNVKGLEHPFIGQLHPYDDNWFLDNIAADWQYIFTCVPGIMSALGDNPAFGIASDDEEGRVQALGFMKRACEAIAKLNMHVGRQAVQAIEIQTAPNRSQASGSKLALKKSLETMLQWDWQGTQIVIEHCDSLVPEQTPAKGFLSIEDEVEVLNQLNQAHEQQLAMVVNWGRSVIETRSVDGAIQHIELLKQNGLLSGLMFSGVSDQNTEYRQWADTHMPPAPSANLQAGAEHSLMTEQQMSRCLHKANAKDLPIVGIKLGIRPFSTSVEQRLAYISDCLAALDRGM